MTAAAFRLYSSHGTAGLAVHWLLIELGVAFDLVMLDFGKQDQRAPDYLALNPAGRVPTLLINGVPHAEVAAPLMLLAERHPGHGLARSADHPDRGAYLQWMVMLANTLQPAFRAWFYADSAASDEAGAMIKDAARVQIEAFWERLDVHFADGRRYLLGDQRPAGSISRSTARICGRCPRSSKFTLANG